MLRLSRLYQRCHATGRRLKDVFLNWEKLLIVQRKTVLRLLK
jgi:hypothetical protein